MITVTNNSVQQINTALIAMKNEIKREIITETTIEQYESDVIDDTITSTSKTWSSEKIASEMYPLGFIYMQLYNPTLASWEKSPSQLGMTPSSGCKWEEITSDFASYPYLKIGSGTTQTGHNAYHKHTLTTIYGINYSYMAGGAGTGLTIGTMAGSGGSIAGTGSNLSYEGNSTERTNEVNASKVKIWKVVEDV